MLLPTPNAIRFAVIVPVYNTAIYLRECLDSVLSQTYENFIVFVVNDGSTDDSSNILDQYRTKDSRLRIIHKTNKGVSSARNTALDLIEKDPKIDFIICLDSDDYWAPQCLETVVKHLNGCKDRMLIFGVQNFDKNGRVVEKIKKAHPPMVFTGEDSFSFAFDNFNLKYKTSPAFAYFLGNTVIPCKCVRGLRFNTTLQLGEDQEYKMRAISKCSGLIVISDLLIWYRLRNGSLSHSHIANRFNCQMFMCLIKTASALSPNLLKIIERKAANSWWDTLRETAKLRKLDDYWNEFLQALNIMELTFKTDILKTPKFRNRVRIFKLGKIATWLYFSIKISKTTPTKMNDYFN